MGVEQQTFAFHLTARQVELVNDMLNRAAVGRADAHEFSDLCDIWSEGIEAVVAAAQAIVPGKVLASDSSAE